MNLFTGFPKNDPQKLTLQGGLKVNLGEIHYNEMVVEVDGRFLTGTSGSYVSDIQAGIDAVASGTVDLSTLVFKIGGIYAVGEGLELLDKGAFGKVAIYNQIPDLPLTNVEAIPEVTGIDFGEVEKQVREGKWSKQAEEILLTNLVTLQ